MVKNCTKAITCTPYDEASESPKAMFNRTFYCFSLLTLCFVALRAIFLSGEEVEVGKTDFVEDEPLCQGCVLTNAHNLHWTP